MKKMTKLRALVLLEKIRRHNGDSFCLADDEIREVAPIHAEIRDDRKDGLWVSYGEALAEYVGVPANPTPEAVRLYIAAARAAGEKE